MSSTMRTFLAVRVPLVRSLTVLIRELDRLGRSVRSVKPEGLHVTLKFLGETRLEDIAAITHTLQRTLQGLQPQHAMIQGIGVFPSPRRPRVIWAGVGPGELLKELAQRCENVCRPLGYPGESREFHPHITLARLEGRPPVELAALLESHAETRFGPLPITEVELIQSDLERGGPRYTTLASLPLGVSGTERG